MWVVVLATIIVVGAGIYFLWWPEYVEFEKNNQILENKGKEIQNKKNYLAEIEASINILSDYEAELLSISSAMPIYDVSEVTLFNFVQKTSSENGLLLQNLSFSPTEYTKIGSKTSALKWKIADLPFSATLAGSYESLKNFILALYSNSRMMEITSLSFSSPESNIYSFDLDFNAKYYIEDNQQVKKPVSPVIPEL
ncbi:MAG: hypothetical protein A2365_03340 [Candidatus Nealsonbacteria bacterium RIFOXYB1_FULL_40_15]|uniref:Uncharacterized protein n=2 Tax=Candidatus Nealsoniibacteriota TaxID=1817911 RepID=A0A1G2ETI2_9BACT|nr:MAG: hypothetical protein A2365_03340 [Candidatus Nealsonbacteria bacterium RIFOXYB1_FULL_40_15]OGZ28822.1 MAG: hypothetical protein A2427_00165 [Candidatus Nealsonbacteria bacterium RIFOXYC1_FULL_40_7]